MAFCKYCGAQLVEGEKHDCPSKPEKTGFDVNAIVKDFVADVVGWFKGEKASVGVITSGVFTVVSYLLNSLFFVFMFVSLSKVLTDAVGGYAKISLPGGISFWYGLLALLVSYAFTLVFDVYKSVAANEKIDLLGGLSRASTTSVVCSATLFVGGLLGMIVWWLAVPFVLLAIVYRVYDYAKLAGAIVKIKNEIFSKYLVAAMLAFVLAVGFLVVGLCANGYVEGLAKGAMGAMSGLFY